MAFAVQTVHASGAETVNGNSAVLIPGGGSPVRVAQRMSLALTVSAASGGTPSMVVSVEWSHDGTTWCPAETADAFTAVTGTGNKVKKFDIKGPFYRLVWTITGTTPSFTFKMTEYADQN